MSSATHAHAGDDPIRVFLSEHILPARTTREQAAIQHALAEAGRRVTTSGQPVHYLRATYVPAQSRWLCLFAAHDEHAVRRAVEIAQVSGSHITPAVDLPPVDDPGAELS